MPWLYEQHSVPLLGGHPQSVINAQAVDRADVVVAFFDSRLGTATPEAVSGTAEKIKRAHAEAKPVHIYFSTEDIPRSADPDQLAMANADREKGRAMWAAAPDFVDLSWQLPRGATGAVIVKNNLEIASVDSDNFRDTDVVPGELASYRVETVGNASAEAATWGLEVTVPEGSGSQSSISSAASDISVAAVARTTSAVSHQTFIAMAKVNAPPAGCGQYSGSKFEFDGNNR